MAPQHICQMYTSLIREIMQSIPVDAARIEEAQKLVAMLVDEGITGPQLTPSRRLL